MVKFNTLADRNFVWKKKTLLKKSTYFINNDLPKEIESRRIQMLPILRRAKSINDYKEKVYMIDDKMILDKKRYTIDNLDDLPHDLNPMTTSTQTVGVNTFFFTRYSPFSNHYCGAPFQIGQHTYLCTEQRFFSQKAEYLGDRYRFDMIMAEKDPVKMLDASKKIENLTGNDWCDVEYEVMLRANREKYTQNKQARAALLSTGNTNLAECNGNCKKWGIGFAMSDPDREKNALWGGNWMGQILSILRDEFKAIEDTQVDPASVEMFGN
jgi:ribA/ribD-fused uncharacterized protein